MTQQLPEDRESFKSPLGIEFRLLTASLRAGKSEYEAFRDYCWARCVEPISASDLRGGNDLMSLPQRYPGIAMAMASSTIANGADDIAAQDVFHAGLHTEGIIFRATPKDRRPDATDLVGAMAMEDRLTAARLLGIKFTATALARSLGR